jgi:hypothetical protein
MPCAEYPMPDIHPNTRILAPIYADFDLQAAPYKEGAVCRPGCAYCCTHFGRVDVTTCEALVIHDWIESLGRDKTTLLRQACQTNLQDKQRGRAADCPFLTSTRQCRIYPIRPFSCRRLYSLQPCEARGPVVHRQVMACADRTIHRLQAADINGYTGHITVILHLLNQDDFRRSYARGVFDPKKIAAFGRAHGLIINRSAPEVSDGPPRHHI